MAFRIPYMFFQLKSVVPPSSSVVILQWLDHGAKLARDMEASLHLLSFGNQGQLQSIVRAYLLNLPPSFFFLHIHFQVKQTHFHMNFKKFHCMKSITNIINRYTQCVRKGVLIYTMP